MHVGRGVYNFDYKYNRRDNWSCTLVLFQIQIYQLCIKLME